MTASLNEKLRTVKWGKYKTSQLFKLQKITNMLSKEDLSDKFCFPAYSSESTNNGIIGYTDSPEFICDDEHPVFVTFGDHTRTFNIATQSFSVLDNVKVLLPNIHNIRCLLWIITAWQKQIPNIGYARHWKIAKNCIVELPTKDGEIDFDFMEECIRELEEESTKELNNYLTLSGLKEITLTKEEEISINSFEKLHWEKYNLEKLFGKSTRGKRLKSANRIPGKLPFVTAGESDEGVSDFIGNDVQIFSKNTTTIDMFGSAKYRNYEYGADDHIAVVHTEKLPTNASIFVTTAIHKSSHNGHFDYGRNFYAKDADDLNILLPTKDEKPDFDTMAILISAIKKLVIKDMVGYLNEKQQEFCYMYNELGEIDNLKVAEESEEYKFY